MPVLQIIPTDLRLTMGDQAGGEPESASQAIGSPSKPSGAQPQATPTRRACRLLPRRPLVREELHPWSSLSRKPTPALTVTKPAPED